MSYAVGYVFYGLNLNTDEFNKFDEDRDYLNESGLAKSHYSGNGTKPLYVGSCLEELETDVDIRASNIQLTPSPQNINEFIDTINTILNDENVSEGFKEKLGQYKPDVWLVWGSS